MLFFHKVFYYLSKDGFCKTLKRIFLRLWYAFLHFPYQICDFVFCKHYLRLISEKCREKNVFICLYSFEWNLPLFQRPHQIASVLARLDRAYVIFVSDEYRYDNFPGILRVQPHLDVISKRLVPHLSSALDYADNVIVFKCWPMQENLLDYIHYDKLVYEYIDGLSLLDYATEEMRKTHYRLIQEADLTVCTARILYDDALPYARHILLSPNAGDYAFFHENRNCASDPQVSRIVQGYECALGYYGCLAEWFDYELVIEIARRKPTWCFVLVGYCFDDTVSRLIEAEMDNIYLIDAQPYQKLPSFVSAFDIQTIPFCLNSVTSATSPVKLFEYMASGKPILTSKMPECLRYRSVTTYENADDFVTKAERLLECRNDPDYVSVMEVEAKENTWESRVEEILDELKGE